MINKRTARLSWFAIAIVALLILPATADACPTCKDALHHDAALGYAISIVFMMVMPMVIAGFWAITIWRLRSKMITNPQAASDTSKLC